MTATPRRELTTAQREQFEKDAFCGGWTSAHYYTKGLAVGNRLPANFDKRCMECVVRFGLVELGYQAALTEGQAREPAQRPSDTLLMLRAISICERLKDMYNAGDVEFVYQELHHVRRYASPPPVQD